MATTGAAFVYAYPSIDKYTVSLQLGDTFANTASKDWAITLTTGDTSEDLHILSIPKASQGDG
jgi:hypothetical protein